MADEPTIPPDQAGAPPDSPLAPPDSPLAPPDVFAAPPDGAGAPPELFAAPPTEPSGVEGVEARLVLELGFARGADGAGTAGASGEDAGPEALEGELPDDAPDNVVALRPVADAGEPDEAGGPPPPELLVAATEACLFASSGVVTVVALAGALQVVPELVEAALSALDERLRRTGAGVRLVPVGDGWQLRTDARLARWVAAVRGGKPVRLSRPALETLAVVAFRQPVTKGAVDELRGVDCGGVLRMLLDRGLLKIVGRSDEPGRPLTYGTTPAFLELFGMRSLADLPTLKDLRALKDDDPPDDGGVLPFPEG